MSRRNQFPPWLVARNCKDNESIKIRCVFSKMSYHAPPSTHERNWVANTDGTAVRYFTAGPCSGLHDTLMGGHTLPLPPFLDRSNGWEQMEDPDGGIVNGDDTILLFREPLNDDVFRAALLSPGNVVWTLVERKLGYKYSEFCVVYHGGKIMVTRDASLWHVITPHEATASDVLVHMRWMPNDYMYYYGYALETRGELLWVSVHIDPARYRQECSRIDTLVVFVHVLQEVTEGPEKLRWVMKDCRSLADRVVFLGWPNSFAVDASGRLGGDGGYAYFLFENYYEPLGRGHFSVFRYNLVDKKAELVDWLPKGWPDEWGTWVVPQPAIAPIGYTSAMHR